MSKPIKTALLSFGMSGKLFHAPFIDLHAGFQLTGAWERSKKIIGGYYPHAKSYASLEELLADDVELVIINTPSHSHYEYAKKALLEGKHVIVEKPFTIKVSEGEELKAIAKEKNKKIFPYQNRRFNSDYLTVKKVIDEGWLGEIVEAELRYDRFNEELSPKLHKEVPGPGAGILYDLGPHLIDQALQLFGTPQALFADLDIIRPLSRVHDYFEIILFYPKLRVRLKSGYQVREPLPGYMLFGRKGTFLKSKADVQEGDLLLNVKPNTPNWGIEPEAEQGLLHTEKDGAVIRKTIPTEKGDYMQYFNAVHLSLTEDHPFPVTTDQAIHTIKIIEAALKSNEEKRVVEVLF